MGLALRAALVAGDGAGPAAGLAAQADQIVAWGSIILSSE
jgi:hypothetical protein